MNKNMNMKNYMCCRMCYSWADLVTQRMFLFIRSVMMQL